MGMNWNGIGENFIGGTINQLGSGLVSSLFGPSVKKQLKWQKEAQMELNRDAAHINYQYGEMAAQNAYNRQMKMYERSYNDQTFGAMRNQMENAGLSVGLMYGGSGSGGGAGQMSGAPQGATGGAVAGDAAAQLSAAIAMKQLKIQEATAFAQNAKAYAEAEEIKSRKEKNEADTEQTIQATEQARDSFEWILRSQKEDAKGKYLENAMKQFMMEVDNFKDGKEISDKQFGKLRIKASAFFNTEAINRAAEVAIKRDDVDGANLLRNAQKLLEDKKTYYYATEVLTGMITAMANAKNADTARLEYGLHKLTNEWDIKLTDAKINEIANNVAMGWKELDKTIEKIETEMKNQTKETEFNTGKWAKFKIIMGALSAFMGSFANVIGAEAKAIDAVIPF